MAKNDDMRERLQSLETKFDRLEQKVDQLPTKADLVGFATKPDLAGFATKADLAGFATKADLTAFAEAMTDKMGIMLGDAKDSVKKAAEGYGGTLERIERDLNEFRSEWRHKSDDTDRVLTDHVNRIVALERRTGLSRE